MNYRLHPGQSRVCVTGLLTVFSASSVVRAEPALAGRARLYGDSTRQDIHDSVQTPDGGYLMVGATKLDAPPNSALMINLDSSGQVVWARSYGAHNEFFNSIIPLLHGTCATTFLLQQHPDILPASVFLRDAIKACFT
ncbi:MAG: hypothetical protein V2G42_07710 [bacterium JZ-2024 1]